MDPRKVLTVLSLAATLLSLHPVRASHAPVSVVGGHSGWGKSLRRRLARLEAKHPGQLGVYVKDLSGGEELSWRGEDSWYLASGVKVPVAIEVLRQVDAGRIALDMRIRIEESDYLDGAGQTNSRPPGSRVTVRYLLEQMLIHSDNTASDLLIRLVGLDQVNRTVQAAVPEGFAPITTLADVRRYAYSGIHPGAFRLENRDFRALKAIRDDRSRVQALARLLHLRKDQLLDASIDSSFDAYYARRLNSGTLRAYGQLLERVSGGQLLKPASRRLLMDTLAHVETGANRIKAGLPDGVTFAHKTGTQHRRICDFGIATTGVGPGARRVLIAACTRGFAALPEAESALREVGEAVAEAGVLARA